MGRFNHEAAAVDPVRRVVYLTEDQEDGCLYRFRPATWPDLSTGTLEVATGDPASPTVTWAAVPDPSAAAKATRSQVKGARRFRGGEGAYYDRDQLFFTTKGDGRVWSYDAATSTVHVVYDAQQSGGPLTGVDNVTVSRDRQIFVAEDGGNMEVCAVSRAGAVSPVVRVVGQDDSELTGVAFNPFGDRLYFSSQRGTSGGRGITYEVTGPF
jgi:secreted PhoX family phosphatase